MSKLNGLKVGITRFPGTNCDRDVWKAVEKANGKASWLWHTEHFDPKAYDAVIVPGGFSFGDYLRAGRLAAKSPVMSDVIKFAKLGKPVLGICNGFQILCEVKLLPGVLLKNQKARFIDRWIELKLSNSKSFWYSSSQKTVKIPIAHGQGRFYADDEALKRMQDNGQIWWTYNDNPNGSLLNIAGVTDESGKVAALMPHPERCVDQWMGGSDGFNFFN
jgi:phosphoribosylformylglycinamidine synthase subunit PurQ / glutaminase